MTGFAAVPPLEAEIITRLAGEIWPRVYTGMISQEQIDYMLAWMYAPAKIREEITEKHIVYLYIEKDREKIGFLAFGPVSTGQTVFIHKIYLSPDHHRQGIGSLAITEIETRCRVAGAIALELRVNRHNLRAIGLYQKAGFVIDAEDCAEIGGGFVMDDYIFRKSLI
jgi:GNAT superfamily N-acetyltransferase